MTSAYPFPGLSKPTPYTLRGQALLLLPQKAIFWPQEQCLIIADLHADKIKHLRKAGVAMPAMATGTEIQRLTQLIQQYNATHVLVLGDLFHSRVNSASTAFLQWVKNQSNVRFRLVKGNHDVLPDNLYKNAGVEIVEETLDMPPFIFSHIPLLKAGKEYNLAGHLHPGVTLRGKAKQYLKLPCFHFGLHAGILPAFGDFTGLVEVTSSGQDDIFVIAGKEVIKI